MTDDGINVVRSNDGKGGLSLPNAKLHVEKVASDLASSDAFAHRRFGLSYVQPEPAGIIESYDRPVRSGVDLSFPFRLSRSAS